MAEKPQEDAQRWKAKRRVEATKGRPFGSGTSDE
jgi:hypothetical protein